MKNTWHPIKKISFLFLLVYVILYCNSVQFLLSNFVVKVWHKVVPLFASLIGYKEVAHIEMTGSGDTTFDYFTVFFFLSLSLLLGPIVFFIGRRINYESLTRWMLVLLRYFLAFNMVSYGFAKLYYLQFSAMTEISLDSTYGESSPMGLLWNFMGHSQGYCMFTGILELIGGLLLLSRKTQTLGALTTFGVMLNVFMLNMCFDVPVKLLSGHMVLFSLLIIAYDRERLWNNFFKNEAVSAFSIKDIIAEKYQKAKTILKWLVILGWLGFSAYSGYEAYQQYGPNAKKPALAGAYEVTSFNAYQDGIPMDPIPDSIRWKTIYHVWEGVFYCKSKTKKSSYASKVDTIEKTIDLKLWKDSIFQTLHYEQLDENGLHLQGNFYNDSLDLVLKLKHLEDYPLVNRGFHWISEYPYNR